MNEICESEVELSLRVKPKLMVNYINIELLTSVILLDLLLHQFRHYISDISPSTGGYSKCSKARLSREQAMKADNDTESLYAQQLAIFPTDLHSF